jgi:hypothetical protein
VRDIFILFCVGQARLLATLIGERWFSARRRGIGGSMAAHLTANQ